MFYCTVVTTCFIAQWSQHGLLHSGHNMFYCTVVTTCFIEQWSQHVLLNSGHNMFYCTVVTTCFIAQWSQHVLLHSGHNMFYCTVVTTCFGHSCGHLQGGENKNTNIIKMCLNQSTVRFCILRDQFTVQIASSLTNLDHISPHVSSMHKNTHTPNNNS